MAHFFTQAFDCDQDEVAAKQIASAFSGFEADLSDLGLGKLDCIATRYWAKKTKHQSDDVDDWWVVSIEFPRLTIPSPSRGLAEHELHVPETMEIIRGKIYDKVKQMDGFRAAKFCCEAQDDLGDHEDWLTTLEEILSGKRPKYLPVILKKSLTTGRQIESDVTDFSPGYVLYAPEG